MENSIETTNIEIAIAVLFGSLMLALIGVFMFLMVIIYQKRKINAIREQQQLIVQYEQAVLKAKVEIREETLKYVGQELHDNVGQVLSLIKLYLSRPDTQRKADVGQLIDQAIKDIRLLSHDLNINRVEQYSLNDFIEQELNKVLKAGIVKISFENQGFCEPTSFHDRLMISRIFQECINNILKHADAKHIIVKLVAEDGGCALSIADDGIGFESDSTLKGAGLNNIYDRVRLIGGRIEIMSSPGDGTKVILRIPQE
ncbi:sensor histidine kinase [Parapedobacter sp. 10938]|uniref:sensor histidine kinase n=1 Tax=Parapedobacter flavus TaxID=3110225 RepID=UPI002DBFA1C3|nr:sensor histidine kinase [Parapedobacter sp. 10938]MEC3879672.1 sensor histidine kinase [Parapedobacter sp. 10938]